MRRAKTFTNWAGNQSCLPTDIRRPASTSEVAELVGAASERNGRIKVAGSGHSFTDAACTDGCLLRIDALDEVTSVDLETHRVKVGAGIRLSELNERLDELGLALPNLGDIAVQTLAGATATATHGTGVSLGNLSTVVVGFELVTGTGEVLWCDRERNSEVFSVGRVGIGALGVVTKIELECVPAFVLRATERVEPVGAVMSDWRGFIESADHAEMFVIPGTGMGFTKRNRRTNEAPDPPSRVQHFVDKELTENLALDLTMRAVRRFPRHRDRLARGMIRAASNRSAVDKSFRIFASPRRVKFTEMEYSIPLDAVPEALERVDAAVRSMPEPTLFPIEVRCSAGDDIALSTAEGRTSGWIAVHQYRGVPYGDYFRAVERIMDDYEGRPHWGKLHFQPHDVLRERYAHWDEFAAVRLRLDPNGTFRNPYLDRVLGPVC